MFFIWVWIWWTTGRAKASLRSRPLGGWVRELAVLSAAPAPSTAPIAARRRQGVSSETTAPSRAPLRQQGVAESLLALGRPMVAACIITHRTRAARHRLPIPITPSANPTPAFAGRWDPTSHKPRPALFSSTVHGAFSFGKTKENGGCIPAAICRIPRGELPHPRGCEPHLTLASLQHPAALRRRPPAGASGSKRKGAIPC